MDLVFEEFNIIGETIGSFASEEATVVVGTSLVPEMSDEIRDRKSTRLNSSH